MNKPLDLQSNFILNFATSEENHSLLGGKGGNLARLIQAGFRVPQGFCVSTHAYQLHISDSGLAKQITSFTETIDYGDADNVEKVSAEIRQLIVQHDIPAALKQEIGEAYRSVTNETFVAVRSSGTAEDLAEASFAGLHDTYLDIKGEEQLLDAIRRCWASLWTARAVAYRHSKGFEHMSVSLCVVVQEMVASDVSGVMFTANPMNAQTNEVTANASWGLGEAIVSGIVTPDEIIVDSDKLEILENRIGTKELRIDRLVSGGTATTDVPEADRRRSALTESEVAELARLGLRVQEYYGGLPQDIEWALCDGTFYLLQSRPITGVDFSWDSDVDGWKETPEDKSVTWTKAMADEVWTGAITPLFYSWRAYLWQLSHDHLAQTMGLEQAEKMWFWKFHKSEAYYNTSVQKILVEDACPPPFRALMLGTLPPEEREAATVAPFDTISHLKGYFRTGLNYPTRGFFKWLKVFDELVDKTVARGREYLNVDVSQLTDKALKQHIDDTIEYEGSYYVEIWVPFWIYARDMSGILAWMLDKWYDGENDHALVDLMTGVPKRTVTMEENYQLWQLSEKIRHTPELLDLFNSHQNADFLVALQNSDAGREYLEEYTRFLHMFGHRGHQDRDMYFSRRSEDPAIDYRSLKAMLSVKQSHDPEEKEQEINQRREKVLEEVVQNIRKKPLGYVPGELFKLILDYVLKFLMARDNERMMADVTTMAIKRGCEEIGWRLEQRGLLQSPGDFYFLAKLELYDLIDGKTNNMALVRAKIAARKRNFVAYLNKTAKLGPYLRRGQEIDLDSATDAHEDGQLQGAGTSRGRVSGIARVVHSLDEIGRVEEGEILICHATDPGWTPVFIVIAGLVLETGGVLAHGSCLSREYGLPCVQLANATQLIPDGAKITVNGDTGNVVIDEVE
ncbi:MAG: PEP-utilizing enzyme [Halieaceae bacterium]|nr:PEP-utilizing enzyme [Halieaceae bacterium]